METKKQVQNTEKESEVKKKTIVREGQAKPKAKSAAKSIEEVVKQLKSVEKEVKAAEKKEVAFVPDDKDKKPKDYAERVQIAARYTDDQAKNMLRKKIAQYKEVHLRFLQKIEEPTAFKTEKLFVPVYCGKADVRYSWKTKVNKEESAHEEICTKEKRFSSAKPDLDVTNFLLGELPQVEEKKSVELVEKDGYTFKKTVGKFNACLKAAAPAKHAKIEKRDETYSLVYVPVMKTTCTLDGEKYVGYVNLYNGACYSSYKVSDVLEKAAEKATLAAKLAKRTLWGTFLFSLTFCLLTIFSALKLTDWSFGALTTKAVWATCVLAALSLPSLVLMLGINAIKKSALIDKSIRLNKLPGVAWPRFASVVGILCTIGAVLLFFFDVMI